MIPILGCPVLNRGDLLLRMVRSIDYPVGRIVLVNNGSDPGVCAVCDQLRDERDFALEVYRPAHNLGAAASWNCIMQCNKDAGYWLLVGNDIQFSPGDLGKIDGFVGDHPDYAIMPANWGHSLFAVTRAGLDRIGFFDENFYPAYLEDSDHMRRVQLAGAPWQDVPDIHAIHGEPPTWGSHTIYADPDLFAMNQRTHANNFRYYLGKWGGGPGEEKFEHPYNDQALTLKDWKIDQDLAKANGNPCAR